LPLALLAGFLLDIFSSTQIGISIILLIIIGFLLKKTQSLLRSGSDSFPFTYFAPFFLVCFVVYQILHLQTNFDFKFLIVIVYTFVFSAIGFWAFKNNARKI
jgi:cell shape-determining protein MreD